jgi:hypothetical protein
MWNLPLRNFSAAGVALLLLAAVCQPLNHEPAVREEAAPGAPVVKVDQPDAPLAERILQLPEDAGVWHTTIVYPQHSPSDAASRRLSAALVSDARLRSLLAQTKTYVYASTDPLWRERLQKYYGDATPAIVLQMPDGRVCYKASGANLPAQPHELADAIATALEQCRPRPAPTPAPSPTPSPQPTIPDLTPPALTPATPEATNDGGLALWMILAPLVAGLAGLVQEWKQSN